jgi:hypothetical protein
MRRLKWLLLLLLSPLLIIVFLTVVGILIPSRQLISICGLVLFGILFYIFAFTDRFIELFETLRSANSPNTKESRKKLRRLTEGSLWFAVLIRGFFLSASFWVVDLYLSLCVGGVRAFVEQIGGNIITSAIVIALAGIDAARGKSLEKQGLLTRAISVTLP